jgi:hypothetical protein
MPEKSTRRTMSVATETVLAIAKDLSSPKGTLKRSQLVRALSVHYKHTPRPLDWANSRVGGLTRHGYFAKDGKLFRLTEKGLAKAIKANSTRPNGGGPSVPHTPARRLERDTPASAAPNGGLDDALAEALDFLKGREMTRQRICDIERQIETLRSEVAGLRASLQQDAGILRARRIEGILNSLRQVANI